MKLTNEVLQEAITLEQMIKDATKRLDEIKTNCKQAGSFSTREFVVAVTDQSRTSLAGMADVAAVFGAEKLKANGLIRTHTYQIVKIAKKEAA